MPHSKMKKGPQLPTLLLALGLAATAQAFLVRQESAWTLFPGLALFALSAFLWVRAWKADKPEAPSNLSANREAALFAVILLVGLFFRTYHLGQYPPGLYNDAAKQGYAALRVLHEGWSPFQEPDQYLGGSLASGIYEYAFWFRFLSPTPQHLLWGSVILSLLAFPFLYLFFRRLAGPETALTTLFLFAVMRWDVTYARGAHPAVDYPFFLFGTLACWLGALQTGRRTAFLAFILFAAGGCYSYEAFVAVLPALFILGLYEYHRDPSAIRKDLGFRMGGLGLFALLTWPVWKLHWTRGGFGAVYDRMGLPALGGIHGLGDLAGRVLSNLLMYNRHGDLWFYHNIPGHRMLDDGTGVLWVLGLAMALWTFRQRLSFYSVTAWALLALPAILSPYPPHASRGLGDAGFAAFFAAWALTAFARKAGPSLFPKLPGKKVLLGLGLAFITVLNFRDYFGEQAKDLSPWRDAGWAATIAGERAARSKEEVYVASRFSGNYALLFQAYGNEGKVHAFEGAGSLPDPAGKGLLFLLDEGKAGVLQWLQELYPNGEVERTADPQGRTLVYLYRVPEGKAGATPLIKAYQHSALGLAGSYFPADNGAGRPALVRREPLVNFTFRNDFPLAGAPPLFAHWSGSLNAPATGPYRFLGLTTDDCRLLLDQREVFAQGNRDSAEVLLKKGPHRLDLYFRKTTGTDAAMSLLWKGPGDGNYRIIPASAYRISK